MTEPWEKHHHKDPQHICVWLHPRDIQYAPITSLDDRHWMAARHCQWVWGACAGEIDVYDMSGNLVSRWKLDIAGGIKRLR